MTIALFHKHFLESHLEEVKKEMEKLGAPTVKAIWSELYGLWLAVEGCHRIRAAKDLGIEPVIEDVSNDEFIIIQVDGEDESVCVADLEEELTENAPYTKIIDF